MNNWIGPLIIVAAPILFLCSFAALWLFISGLLAVIGGWDKLAAVYASQAPFAGERFHYRYGSLGWVAYRACLTLGANQSHLFIGVLAPFKFRHPDLQIPFSDISMSMKHEWFIRSVCLQFQRAPEVRLVISAKLAAKLAECSAGSLVLPQEVK